ncbi:MAG: ABC transporter ATP-binding protein, partial [Burkholderiales bacterium]|nr:ABC transporter ATP-binding protein [Burkholderiales bacterium]
LFEGRDLVALPDDDLRKIRGTEIAMIFQDPLSSLHPFYKVGVQLTEAVHAHRDVSKGAARERAVELLDLVGIPDPSRRVDQFPHEFSGGMRQRVMIAMALACKPDLLIADEPTTALDVTVQAQIFDLVADLRERTGTAVMLITHDMGAVAEMADRVVVMYAGRIVESGPVATVLGAPLHPYTRGLIACAPGRRTAVPGQALEEIPGTVPSLLERGAGCLFADRCAHASAICRSTLPPRTEPAPGHGVACWLHVKEGSR